MGGAVAPGAVLMLGGPAGLRRAPMTEAGAAMETDVAALAKRVTAAEARADAAENRFAALEALRVARYTAQAALPNLAIGAAFTLRLTDLVPARAGDKLKAGAMVIVRPAGALPAGVEMAGVPTVPADGVVLQPMKATAAVTAGAALSWIVIDLRV